jgi:hypothetical protein
MSWYVGGGSKLDVPKLAPQELFERRKQRDGAKLRSYNKILEQIYTRIRTASREGADPWIIYTVPPFILGLPRIEMEDCIVYLVYMLRQQSYEVRYTYPNLLYVSWKHHEKDYILNGSPIMQSMLATTPTAASSKPKAELRGAGQGQARVRFQDEMLASSGGGGGGGGSRGRQQHFQTAPPQNKAPPRSVNSYTPPASFLNAIEQPMTEPRKSALDDFLNF